MASDDSSHDEGGRRVMTIGRQVLLGYLAPVVLALLIVLVATAALRNVTQAKNLVIERDTQLVIDAYRLAAVIAEQAAADRAYFLTRNESDLRQLDELEARYDEVAAALRDEVHTDTGRSLLAEIDARKAVWERAAAVVVAAVRAGADAAEVANLAATQSIPARDELVEAVAAFIDWESELIAEDLRESDATAARARWLVWLLGAAAVVLALVIAAAITRRVSARLRALATNVDRAGSEVLAGMTQQVTGFTEQAAAVQETVATVDELVQTAEQSAERARSVAARAQRATEVAQDGKAAVEDTATGMDTIREQVDAIAQNVVALAERAQAISDIIDAVDDIAEQTHLLALNAAIEAARAGEHGKGFAVVAAEVKNLADQSRRATGQVGAILGEIQRGTNTTVMATESGTKSVTDGIERVGRAGDTITELAEMVESATLAAEQIAASSGQQAVATSQISQAMKDVGTVIDQNQAASRQTQQVARDLNAVSQQMKALVGVA